MINKYSRSPDICLNTNMKELRDIHLVWRFFYYSEVKRMRIDDVIANLSLDFFLSPKTVEHYIQQLNDDIINVLKQRPSLSIVINNNNRFSTNITKHERKFYTR